MNKNQKQTNSKSKMSGRSTKNAYRSKDVNDRTTTKDSTNAKRSIVECTSNNPDWYGGQAYRKLAANLSFAQFPGFATGFGKANDQNANGVISYGIPGFMSVNMIPVYDLSTRRAGAASPINSASKAIYTWVRHENSGSKNYEAPDLMMMILAMDTLYFQVAEVKRALDAVLVSNPKNRYYPQDLMQVLGFDYADISGNFTKYSLRLNIIINKINQIRVPAVLPIMSRHSYLMSHVFMDSSNAKAQVYVPRFRGGYYFSGKTNEKGSELRFFFDQPHSDMGEYLDEIEHQINLLLADEDIGIMSGDIMKAYKDNTITLQPYVAGSGLTIEHSLEMLLQVQNSISLPRAPYIEPPHVVQDNGLITQKCEFLYQEAESGEVIADYVRNINDNPKILSTVSSEPTPEEVMEFTRLRTIFNCTLNGQEAKGEILHAGSEIVLNYTIYVASSFNGGNRVLAHLDFNTYPIISEAPFANNGHVPYALCSGFDFAPFRYLPGDYSISVDKAPPLMFVGDVDNFTFLDDYTLTNCHDIALMGEYGLCEGKYTGM